MTDTTPILILLSTYQGEKYLATQLDSIISQSYTDWTLVIRDDGSRDGTLALIKTYAEIESRIHLLSDNLGNIKPAKSFAALMHYALTRNENYIFFCDQDDVWQPNKLALQVNLLNDMQAQYGNTMPLLIHSDLSVVDQRLQTIHPSFLRFEKISRNTQAPLNTLLINNFVTGCTMGINRALLNIVTPVPDDIIMHDWWCALCASAMGKIAFLNEASVLYRQHSHNSIGSQGFYGKLKELAKLKTNMTAKKKNMGLCFAQAAKLLARMDKHAPHFSLITSFLALEQQSLFSRYLSASKIQLKATNQLRMLAFWFMLAIV